MKNKLIKKIFSLHSYLGLISGIFILIFSLTGAIILFIPELDRFLYSEIITTQATERKISFDEAYRLVSASYPDYTPYRILQGINGNHETIEISVQKDNFKERFSVYVDPESGKITGELRNPFTRIALKLHYSFLLGKAGEVLAAVFALTLIGSILSGIVVYKKYILKVLMFKVPLKFRNWRTASSELHRVLGVWTLLFNFLLAFSGFWMLRHTFDLKNQFAERKVTVRPEPLTISIDKACMEVKEKIPGIRINYISLPRVKGDNVFIRGATPGDWLLGNYAASAEFDVRSGEIKKLIPAAQMAGDLKFANSLYTLHFGQYGGLAVKIIYCFFSLATAAISITGFMLWWRRNRKPSKIIKGKKPQKQITLSEVELVN